MKLICTLSDSIRIYKTPQGVVEFSDSARIYQTSQGLALYVHHRDINVWERKTEWFEDLDELLYHLYLTDQIP